MSEAASNVIEHKSIAVQLKEKERQFTASLPKHIPVERFMRVVMTALQQNPRLEQADRASFWIACNKAASDGLLPDGREGAFVVFRTKDGGGWVQKVQWMPMRAGIMKKVRNSGELATWEQHVVYEKDAFEFELGDNPYIRHKPFIGPNAGEVVAAYSVATLRSGEKSREIMTRAQLEKVRESSRAAEDGPWVDWFDEMCRKAVLRRHSKVLPMNTDLDDLMRRDDELYDFKGAKNEAQAQGHQTRSFSAHGLERLRALGTAPTEAPIGEPEHALADAPANGHEEAQAVANAAAASTATATAEAPPAEDHVIVDQLQEQARTRAKKGKSSLTRFIGGLDPYAATIVNRIGRELNEIAAQAETERS